MSKNFLPGYSDAERLQVLIDTADQIEHTTYYRDLTDDDLVVKRESYVLNSIEIAKHQAELDHAKTVFKAATKPIKAENEILLDQVQTKKELISGSLYHIADHENSLMNTYDEKGEFISSRRLKPSEKQGRLLSHPMAVNQ